MKNKKIFGNWTIFSGFLIHMILGTLMNWSSISRYIYSYLVQNNSIKISKVYLNNIFSLVIVFNNIFILVGILLSNKFDSITITGFGLLIKIYAHALFLFFPNIIIVTFCIFICSAACGICYMPIILEIWKYFPDNKGLTTSLALSGFGFTQLFFEDISKNMINYEKSNIDYIEGVYSIYINDNFKQFLKIYNIFFSVLSVLSMLMMNPYDKTRRYIRRASSKFNFQFKALINNIIQNKGENDKEGNNVEFEFNKSAHLLAFQNKNNKNNSGNNYLDKIKNFFFKKKEKKYINPNKKFKGEDITSLEEPKNDDLTNNLITDVRLLKIPEEKEKNSNILFSLIISYPFLQLTSIFFFTKIFGIIELYSIKNFGSLNGHDEDFLWRGTFLYKVTYFLCFPLWGYLFDKIGFKKFYRIIITLEILISSLCYYMSIHKFGYLIYCMISSFVNSACMAIGPTNFSIIFDNEKGALLFGISCFLTNTFYIFRPLITNLLTEKIYYLIIYLIITTFSMLGFIILCFFIDEKFVNINSRNNSSAGEMGQELNNVINSDKNESSNNGSLSKSNSLNYDSNNTGYTKDKNDLFSEKEHDESSTFN